MMQSVQIYLAIQFTFWFSFSWMLILLCENLFDEQFIVTFTALVKNFYIPGFLTLIKNPSVAVW